MKTLKKHVWILTLVLLATVSGCKKKTENGNVEVKLTDDPFPVSFVASAHINITKIEVKNAETDDYVTVFEGNADYNVAALNNGVTASVSLQSVPAGVYDEVRVTLGGASIELTDGRHFNANINGSIQENAEIEPALRVEGDNNASLLIDVDLAETFEFDTNLSGNDIITNVMQIVGLSNFDFNFRAADLNQSGTVEGTVTDDNGTVYGNATVKLEGIADLDGDGAPDDIITIANAQGEFEFLGVPSGTYTLTVEAEDGTELTASTQVNVTPGNIETVNQFRIN